MGDEPFLRSHCPGGAGCFCDGAEHVYLRERTMTPPRTGVRSSRTRRTSNRGHGVETVTISKTNTHSATISSTSTASVEVTSMVTRRSGRAGSAQPVTPAPALASRRSERLQSDQRAESTTSSERRVSNEYLAYSSDDEFEEFISQPKTDYTYARSVSYSTLSPQHVTPPNMSRRCLHSPGGTPGMAASIDKLDDRYELSQSSRDVRDYSFSREMASRVTSSSSTTAAQDRLADDVVRPASFRASSVVLLRSTSGADGDSSPHTDLSSLPPGVFHRPILNGSIYISRGLDVDSGDEDFVENNNVSKSHAFESHLFNQETRTSHRTVTSVLLTLLYPLTYLWLAASGAGRQLIWRERTADTAVTAAAAAAAPAPAVPLSGTVEYRRMMRGLPQLGAVGGAESRSQRLRSRTTGHQTAAARHSTVTTITNTITTACLTVVSLLWWPVRETAAFISSAGRSSAAWARSVSESADLPRRSAQLLHWLNPLTWVRATAALVGLGPVRDRRSAAGLESSAAHRRLGPLSWIRSVCLAVLSTGQWAATATAETVTGAATATAQYVTGAATSTAQSVTGAASWTAGAVSGAARGTVGVFSGAAKGTAGAFSGAATGTAGAFSGVATGTADALSGAATGTTGALSGAAKSTVGSLAAAGGRVWSSVWPWAGAGAAGGRRGVTLAAQKGGRRRRLCLFLLPLLLLLLLLFIPLLWGLYCEEDPAATVTVAVDKQEYVVLRQLRTAPVTAWTALRDTAAFVGTGTVNTASSVYGYLSLLGGSALLAAPAAAPKSAVRAASAPAPVPAAPAPVVTATAKSPAAMPVAPPAVPTSPSDLTAVYARLEELQTKLAALQTDFQSCRAASEAAAQPAAVRAALGLGSGQLLTAEQLAAAERRQTEQLSAQLAAVQQQLEHSSDVSSEQQAAQRVELEARLVQLESAAGRLQLQQEDSGRSEQRTAHLSAELARLQEEFSELHRTLLVVQESLRQVRSCCNRTEPEDWSALLSKRLRSLESNLEGRLQGFVTTIKQDLASESVTAAAAAAAAAGPGGVSKADVIQLTQEALAQYDADKTGKFDYALESAGGSVISTKCTESYNVKSARISVLGIPLWYPSNNPRTIIQPSVSPGECFAFRGQGYFVLALSRRIQPTGFVMEHIPRSLTPTSAIDSAPRNFTVLGLRDSSDQDGVLLGRYVYRESGTPLQEFPAQPAAGGAAFSVVELRVHDNWGHGDYTCLYRFRVHGRPHVTADADVAGAVEAAAAAAAAATEQAAAGRENR